MKHPAAVPESPGRPRAPRPAVPALARGVAVWERLGRSAAARLEEVARDLALPKASVLRLLDTLVGLGLAERLPDKRYRALARILRGAPDASARRAARVPQILAGLVARTGASAEWWVETAEGLRLERQHLPESEVRVQARPGFLRAWGPELEAVATLAHAFSGRTPALPRGLWHHTADGRSAVLAARAARARIGAARAAGFAADAHGNTNGVRRYAVPLAEPGQPLQVLALADWNRPGRPLTEAAAGQALREAAAEWRAGEAPAPPAPERAGRPRPVAPAGRARAHR